MDKVDLQIAIELEKCLQPVQIPNTCSFWMIRTKSGVYYNEFIRNKYIAIGWNAVLKSALLEATEDNLHRLIETYYTDKQPGAALNKCRRFLENMKPGDIVMILGEKRVSFGIVGEYFEKSDINEFKSKRNDWNWQSKKCLQMPISRNFKKQVRHWNSKCLTLKSLLFLLPTPRKIIRMVVLKEP